MGASYADPSIFARSEGEMGEGGPYCRSYDPHDAFPIVSHHQQPIYRKPAKMLAGRYLLGETIGRGSYGKVRYFFSCQR